MGNKNTSKIKKEQDVFLNNGKEKEKRKRKKIWLLVVNHYQI